MKDINKLLGCSDKKKFASIMKKIDEKGNKTIQPIKFSFGSIDECKIILWGCLTRVSSITKDNFVYNEGIKDIISWMQNNHGLGLLICGSTGTGKTTIIKALLRAFNTFPVIYDHIQKKKSCKELKMINAKDLVLSKEEFSAKYSFYGDGDIGKRPEFIVQKKFFAIDDVGRETMKNDYGIKKMPIQDIIEDIDSKKKMVLMSANLKIGELVKKYDDRTIDRILKNFAVVEFDGKSLR